MTPVTLGAGKEGGRSGLQGTTKIADPCCKLGSMVCNWRFCPGKFVCSSGSSSKWGGTFRSGLHWASLACIWPWSFSIWVSRLQFSSFSSFFSMVICPMNATMWNPTRYKDTVGHQKYQFPKYDEMTICSRNWLKDYLNRKDFMSHTYHYLRWSTLNRVKRVSILHN